MAITDIAPEGQIFICSACGKASEDIYGDKRHSYGWDVSCSMHAMLCYDKKEGLYYVSVEDPSIKIYSLTDWREEWSTTS